MSSQSYISAIAKQRGAKGSYLRDILTRVARAFDLIVKGIADGKALQNQMRRREG